MTEKLLLSRANDYAAGAGKAIGANGQAAARKIAAVFQNKVVTYSDGVLGTAGGVASVRSGLECHTSSPATFDDLGEMLCVMHARWELAEFTRALPAKIGSLEGDRRAKMIELLNGLRARRADAMSFALTMIVGRLETSWQLIHLATKLAASRTAMKIAATPYAAAVSMVLDQVDDKRPMLIYALKHNRVLRAKEILTDIRALIGR